MISNSKNLKHSEKDEKLEKKETNTIEKTWLMLYLRTKRYQYILEMTTPQEILSKRYREAGKQKEIRRRFNNENKDEKYAEIKTEQLKLVESFPKENIIKKRYKDTSTEET